MPALLVATHNSHKTGEIAAILADFFDDVTDLTAHPDIPPAVEDGETFEANAAIKALAASEAIPDAMILADDSGIEVDALDREPGVYSARYSGPDATDASNREKLLAELARTGARGRERTGRFRCVLVLAKAGQVIATFDGAVEGIVANESKGEGGFGYDPLFIPEGYCETFGQLPPETKHQLSHRGRALAQLKAWLEGPGSGIGMKSRNPYQPHRDRVVRLASAIRAADAIRVLDLYPAHKRELLSICVWKATQVDGKLNTQFYTRAALMAGKTEKLQHEHVFERKKLVDEMILGEPAEKVLGKAVACVITRGEHQHLTNVSKQHPELDGWERYRAAGIEVVDREG